jgi:hypothetical protein
MLATGAMSTMWKRWMPHDQRSDLVPPMDWLALLRRCEHEKRLQLDDYLEQHSDLSHDLIVPWVSAMHVATRRIGGKVLHGGAHLKQGNGELVPIDLGQRSLIFLLVHVHGRCLSRSSAGGYAQC